MSLLSICTQAANYAQLIAPTSIVSNSDPTALLLLASAQLAGQSVARRPEGGWVSQILEYEFQTQASTVNYSGTVANTGTNGVAQIVIANGVDSTFLDALDNTWVVTGTGLFNNTTVSSVSVDGSFNYTITCNIPASTPGAGTYSFGKSDYTLPSDFQRPIDNTFWDRTRYWSMRGPQSPQQWQLYKSSVIGRASIQRRFRFRQIGAATRLSIDPVPTDNGSFLVFEYVSNGWCKSASGTVQTQWQADTDVGIIDEYLIELETIWRVLRRLGLSYADEMAESERQISKSLAVDGAAAVLDLTPRPYLGLLSPANLPESDYGPGYAGVGSGFAIGLSEIG